MSTIAPTASIASQPPISPIQPIRAQPDPKVAEQNAAKGAQLTATAVAAQASKESGKGLIVDIQA